MNDFLINMALNHFGFNDDQKAQITADIPKIAYVANLIKQHKTLINELIDLFDMVSAQVVKTESQQ